MGRRWRLRGWLVFGILTMVAAGCSGSDGASSTSAEAAGSEETTTSTVEVSVATGEQLATLVTCSNCHSYDGSPRVTGPTLAGLVGLERELSDGSSVVADTAYIRKAIADPAGQIVAGWEEVTVMPTFYADQFSDAQIDSLVLFVESLSP